MKTASLKGLSGIAKDAHIFCIECQPRYVTHLIDALLLVEVLKRIAGYKMLFSNQAHLHLET